MEEDIKILEEGIKNGTIYVNCGNSIDKAIENLIKGYRELEKRIIFLTNLSCINDSDENYIQKSKIKSKIEELEKQYKQMEQTSDFIIADIIQPKIQVLQELMEDK